MYSIIFSKQAKKFLVHLDSKDFENIKLKIKELSLNPLPKNSKKLVNVEPPTFRIRYSRYRILYIINFQKNEVFISKIDKRGKVYKK
ncbi:MAG: type II toxin-antitoxin system RelE family toxin [Candidatus Nanoarchaeia archaeon]